MGDLSFLKLYYPEKVSEITSILLFEHRTQPMFEHKLVLLPTYNLLLCDLNIGVWNEVHAQQVCGQCQTERSSQFAGGQGCFSERPGQAGAMS